MRHVLDGGVGRAEWFAGEVDGATFECVLDAGRVRMYRLRITGEGVQPA